MKHAGIFLTQKLFLKFLVFCVYLYSNNKMMQTNLASDRAYL